MASRIATVTARLRDMILAGELTPGERLIEIPFAQRLGVSRTPLRIALGELEKEGLLERLPTRGFKVREFPMEQVANAIDVRGVLEGMAARNPALTSALEHNERIPMTAAATITFNSAVQELAYPLIRRAHKESCD